MKKRKLKEREKEEKQQDGDENEIKGRKTDKKKDVWGKVKNERKSKRGKWKKKVQMRKIR